MAPIHVTQQQKQHKGLLEQARFSLVRRAFYKSVVVTAASPGTHMGAVTNHFVSEITPIMLRQSVSQEKATGPRMII